METAFLSRREVEDLVNVITAEVVRQMRSAAPGAAVRIPPRDGTRSNEKSDACEGCPRVSASEAVSADSIRLSADVHALAALMDHTLLRPEATRTQIEKLCDEALRMRFAAVCVNPAWVALAAERLRGSTVLVATVAGFPFGATSTAAKRCEAQAGILEGAREVDMVMNIGAMKSGELDRVETDIRGVAEVCHASGVALKVILENGYLTDPQKATACEIIKRSGAEFVKTSTGFGPSGATEADVRLMRQTVGPAMGVKAAGGIRTLNDALRMLQAGATRLGTSSSLAILAEASALLN